MYEAIFYTDRNDNCPMDEFLDDLQPKIKGKVEKWIQKLEEEGPNLRRPHSDKVRGKIRELRVKFGVNYRCLYFFLGKQIILTHGFVKKTQEISESEIVRAERLMKDYLHQHSGRWVNYGTNQKI